MRIYFMSTDCLLIAQMLKFKQKIYETDNNYWSEWRRKGTVAQMLSDLGGYKVICSYTTRPKREGEIDGWQHYFVEKCDVPHDKMLAYTLYGGYEYWTTIDQVTDKAIYVIDEDGLKALCEKFPDIELFKICVTAWEATRLRRGVSQERLDRDQQRNLLSLFFYDAVIFNNGSLESLCDKVKRRVLCKLRKI